MSIRNLLITDISSTNYQKIKGDWLAIDVCGALTKSFTDRGSLLLTASISGGDIFQNLTVSGNLVKTLGPSGTCDLYSIPISNNVLNDIIQVSGYLSKSTVSNYLYIDDSNTVSFTNATYAKLSGANFNGNINVCGATTTDTLNVNDTSLFNDLIMGTQATFTGTIQSSANIATIGASGKNLTTVNYVSSVFAPLSGGPYLNTSGGTVQNLNISGVLNVSGDTNLKNLNTLNISAQNINCSNILCHDISANNINCSNLNLININTTNISTQNINAQTISSGFLSVSKITASQNDSLNICSNTANICSLHVSNMNAQNISVINLNTTNISSSFLSVSQINNNTLLNQNLSSNIANISYANIQMGLINSLTVSGNATVSGFLNSLNRINFNNMSGLNILASTISSSVINVSQINATSLNLSSIDISSITANNLTVSNLATIQNLNVSLGISANSINTSSLNSTIGTITSLSSSVLTVSRINATSLNVSLGISANSINTSSINSTIGTITNLSSSVLTVSRINATSLNICNVDISSIITNNLTVSNLATIQNLNVSLGISANSINTSSINTLTISASLLSVCYINLQNNATGICDKDMMIVNNSIGGIGYTTNTHLIFGSNICRNCYTEEMRISTTSLTTMKFKLGNINNDKIDFYQLRIAGTSGNINYYVPICGDNALFTNISSSLFNTSSLNSTIGTIGNLSSSVLTVSRINTTSLNICSVDISSIITNNLTVSNLATIQNLNISLGLSSNSINTSSLNSTIGTITNLSSSILNVSTVNYNNISGITINASNITVNNISAVSGTFTSISAQNINNENISTGFINQSISLGGSNNTGGIFYNRGTGAGTGSSIRLATSTVSNYAEMENRVITSTANRFFFKMCDLTSGPNTAYEILSLSGVLSMGFYCPICGTTAQLNNLSSSVINVSRINATSLNICSVDISSIITNNLTVSNLATIQNLNISLGLSSNSINTSSLNSTNISSSYLSVSSINSINISASVIDTLNISAHFAGISKIHAIQMDSIHICSNTANICSIHISSMTSNNISCSLLNVSSINCTVLNISSLVLDNITVSNLITTQNLNVSVSISSNLINVSRLNFNTLSGLTMTCESLSVSSCSVQTQVSAGSYVGLIVKNRANPGGTTSILKFVNNNATGAGLSDSNYASLEYRTVVSQSSRLDFFVGNPQLSTSDLALRIVNISSALTTTIFGNCNISSGSLTVSSATINNISSASITVSAISSNNISASLINVSRINFNNISGSLITVSSGTFTNATIATLSSSLINVSRVNFNNMSGSSINVSSITVNNINYTNISGSFITVSAVDTYYISISGDFIAYGNGALYNSISNIALSGYNLVNVSYINVNNKNFCPNVKTYYGVSQVLYLTKESAFNKSSFYDYYLYNISTPVNTTTNTNRTVVCKGGNLFDTVGNIYGITFEGLTFYSWANKLSLGIQTMLEFDANANICYGRCNNNNNSITAFSHYFNISQNVSSKEFYITSSNISSFVNVGTAFSVSSNQDISIYYGWRNISNYITAYLRILYDADQSEIFNNGFGTPLSGYTSFGLSSNNVPACQVYPSILLDRTDLSMAYKMRLLSNIGLSKIPQIAYSNYFGWNNVADN